MQKEIKSKVLETKEIEWQNAKWFQNENLKKLDSDGLEKLKKSLQTNFFIMPFHVWESKGEIWILDGHHRQKALSELASDGIEIPKKLPATFIDCRDKTEAAKYVLIYSSIYAKIQQKGLDEFIKEFDIDIDDVKFEIDLPEFSLPRFEQNFSPIEIDEINEEIPSTEEIELVIKEGDIFEINGHYVFCGDSFDEKFWKTTLQGKKARLVFTDPPYNLPADYIGNKGVVKHKDFKQGAGEMSDLEFMDWLKRLMQKMIEFSINGAIHYICMDFRHIWHMTEAGASEETYQSYSPKQLCVWNKSNGANGDFYRSKHELIFVYKFGEEKHYSKLRLKDRIRYNVWDYASANSLANPERHILKDHPTPKPLDMVRDAIIDVSEKGDIVLDFFLGSGTTLIAADLTKRICYAGEIDPKHCQNSIIRYLRYCDKNGKELNFRHLNGNITIEEIRCQKQQKKPQK